MIRRCDYCGSKSIICWNETIVAELKIGNEDVELTGEQLEIVEKYVEYVIEEKKKEELNNGCDSSR